MTHPEQGPTIRAASPEDAAELARIYDHYVCRTTVTFETEPVGEEQMRARLLEAEEQSLPWIVAVDGQQELENVIGFAHASRWKGRCAYRNSAEVSVYLDPARTGRGLGTRLYRRLFTELGARGLHTAIAGIALPNPASVALHEKLGMHRVATFEQVGRKFGRWIDVGYWQLVFEADAAPEKAGSGVASDRPPSAAVFRARTRELRGGFSVARPVAEVFPLFSPEGERAWVPGWSPEYLLPPEPGWQQGQVFRTREEDGEAAWVVGALDRGNSRVEYHRVEPGRWVVTVRVACRSARDAEASTRVDVCYRFVGLSARGNAAIDAMSDADYAEKMDRWSTWIAGSVAPGQSGS